MTEDLVQRITDPRLAEQFELVELCSNQFWRLNNLYVLVNDEGDEFNFTMRPGMLEFYLGLHFRNIVLKERQYGFSSFILLMILDWCLFRDNISASLICHKLSPDGYKLFKNKVKDPYLKAREQFKFTDVPLPAVTKMNESEISFSNGSSISVGTSARSGTIQLLHVSELGYTSVHHPEKAKEIVTGAFNAAQGGYIFVESTAEGHAGEFKRLSDMAQQAAEEGRRPSRLDFRFFFWPWWKDEKRSLKVEKPFWPARMMEYFDELAAANIKLTDEQKNWYVSTEAVLGEFMMREFPSTPEEAWKASLEGVYLARQMRQARLDGRITRVPVVDGVEVNTSWDFGFRDATAIWWWQIVGAEYHFVDYYENSGEAMSHYAKILEEKREQYRWQYGSHYAPHDLRQHEFISGIDRFEAGLDLGIVFEHTPRPKEKEHGINAVRDVMRECWIDSEHCDRGIQCLDSYRKQWDDVLGVWKDKPLKDWASHGFDAFQTFALARISHRSHIPRARRVVTTNAAGWT